MKSRPTLSTVVKLLWVALATHCVFHMLDAKRHGDIVGARWEAFFVLLTFYWFVHEFREPTTKFHWQQWFLLACVITSFSLSIWIKVTNP